MPTPGQGTRPWVCPDLAGAPPAALFDSKCDRKSPHFATYFGDFEHLIFYRKRYYNWNSAKIFLPVEIFERVASFILDHDLVVKKVLTF